MAEETKTLQTQEKEEIQTNGVERTRARRAYVPRADIYETETDIVLVADMPGVDENSVDVTLEKNVLTITGTVEEMAPENYGLAYAEYGSGDYQRSFTLSNEIDREKIEAMVKNGVLKLRLPKSHAARSRKIAVKGGLIR